MTGILLCLATNAAILLLISITFRVLGIENILQRNQIDLDLNTLLLFCQKFYANEPIKHIKYF